MIISLTFRSKKRAWHLSLRTAINFLLICCPAEWKEPKVRL